MTDLSETANHLIVLWKSGRAKFASFFHVLNGVQAEIGSDALGDWCIRNLRIHLAVIERVSDVLSKVDAEREKLALAEARASQKRLADMAKAKAKAVAAELRHEKELLDARKAVEKQEMGLRKLEAEKQARRVAKNLARAHKRDERVKDIKNNPPPQERLAALLTQAEKVDAMSRIECGRLYVEMKELVQTQQAGKNANHKYWTWGEWSAAYIKRSRSSIKQCVADYEKTLLNGQGLANPQDENVIHFPKTVA
jgi:hypothetical protein